MLLLECLLVDVAIEKTEETNNSDNNVFRIIVILVLFFSFLVSGAYISLSFMHPRSSLEWEFLNHVRSADLFLFIFFMFDVTVDATPS